MKSCRPGGCTVNTRKQKRRKENRCIILKLPLVHSDTFCQLDAGTGIYNTHRSCLNMYGLADIGIKTTSSFNSIKKQKPYASRKLTVGQLSIRIWSSRTFKVYSICRNASKLIQNICVSFFPCLRLESLNMSKSMECYRMTSDEIFVLLGQLGRD